MITTAFAKRLLTVMAPVWRYLDFEGFLGLVLKRDRKLADRYKDW